MNKISKRSKILYLLVFAFIFGVCFLCITLISNAETWALKRANQHIYDKGQLISAGTIYDRNGVVLAETVDGERIFNENKTIRCATLHCVGDLSGFIATGAHTAFKSQLTGYSLINGVYNIERDGEDKDLHLTIDASLCADAYNALGKNNGTIGVYNYETGEILCMVSKPTFDINNKPKDIDTDDTGKYDGIYINRFLSGVFTPGSTFKVVTAACAIENIPDIDSRTFTCTGSYKTSTGVVKCNGVHGTLTFETALNHSCNSAFAQIADELGNEKLTATAEELGFNKRIQVDGINVAKSYFDLTGAVSVDRGWAGIGQYTTLANPCHMVTLMGAIASNGTTPSPHILENSSSFFSIGSSTIRYMDLTTATKLSDMLRSNVENYYGDKKFPNLEMCGKTGTAEVSEKEPHTWFVGFSRRTDTPFAIVVVLENSGGTGIGNAVPVANKVMQSAITLS
ncbi:MAG: penicillin-binding protein [Clostridia bacterium]|nr:penicillin-binding protein [Clostridia bacterium]